MKFFSRFLIPLAVVGALYFVLGNQPTGSGSPVDALLELVHGPSGEVQNPIDAVASKAEAANEQHQERLAAVEKDMFGE